jgi:LmbE family N-acetylglucosaminyl deacetylase
MDSLAFFAHPDDETMLLGGTLALLARHGVRVHYLSATRGEGGEVGEPPVCRPGDLGPVRARELACAVEALGGASLTFMDYVDPRIGPGDELFAFTADMPGLVEELRVQIRRLAPKAIFTHGTNGEYGHPAHIFANQAVRMAGSTMGPDAPVLYTVSPSFPDHPKPRLANQDDPAHLVIDVSSSLTQKLQAARCHKTQNALFVRRSSEKAGRLVALAEVLMAVEGLHRIHPPGDGPLTDFVAQTLFAAGVVRQDDEGFRS